jgi:SAM-dependent methyltransferase
MNTPPLSPNAALRWDIIRGHLDRIAPTRVLELGAGQGSVACRLAERATYVGVEPDETSRATAVARLGERGRLVDGLDALADDETFDLACAFEVLEHIEDDKGALTEWVTRVRPGGHVLVSVPADPERFDAADELVGHVRRYTSEELSDLLTAAGLDVVSVDHYGIVLGDALELGRNQIARRRLARAAVPNDAATRTAGSGRTLQPPAWAGTAIWWATAPFRTLQRRYAHRGPGLIALAQRPG